MKAKYSVGQRLWRKWTSTHVGIDVDFDYPASIKEVHVVTRRKKGKIVTEVEYVLGGGLNDIVSEDELLTTVEKERLQRQ